jgi:predicted SAM-dependent methyltransferase
MKIPLLSNLAKKGIYFYTFTRAHYKLKQLRKHSPLRIIIGAGGISYEGWIPTEVQCLNLLNPKHWERYFDKNSIDAILVEHVWEHLTMEEGLVAANQCYQYLKSGGYLRVAVPDGFHPDPEYIEWIKIKGVGPGADDHKVLYNYKTFCNVFERAGFKVELLEYFDSNKEFHYIDWDETKGRIRRSRKFDDRNKNGELKYTSLILDARKNV